MITRQWRGVAAIPTPRDQLAAVALDGTVCAVAGRRLSVSLNLATFECMTRGRIPGCGGPMRRRRVGGAGAAVYDRRVHFIGGEQPSGTDRDVEIFDARTNAWTRGPDLPTARHGLGVVVVQPTKDLDAQRNLITTPPRLLALAGGPTPGGSQTAHLRGDRPALDARLARSRTLVEGRADLDERRAFHDDFVTRKAGRLDSGPDGSPCS